jgi:serine/threonine-protein phosphatase 6 regulatory ankyrin repeat subunit A/serine/threonine-protein phosphatase 6 regulatory ankyrin repeat subunit B
LLRLYVRKPPISNLSKIAIPIIVLIVVVCFYEASPEVLGEEPLQRALSLGDAQKVGGILKSKPALANKPLRFGHMTPLFYATMCRNPARTIDLPIKSGADINARSGGFSLTPLQQAAWSGNVEAVKALLVYKPDVNATEAQSPGRTALNYAVNYYVNNPAISNAEIVDLLLTNGADITHGYPVLFDAENRASIMEHLLEKGANPNVHDSNRDTPLHRAILFGRTDQVAVILRHHPDLSIGYSNGADNLSPLELAMNGGRSDIALMLQNYVLQSRSNTVGFAAANGNLEAIRNLLQKVPQGIEEKDELGFTPLAWAAQTGHKDAASLLLSLGANPNMTSSGGRYPIDWAATSGHLPVVELLADKTSNDRSITLFLAVQQQQIPVVKFLLEHGANPNIHDPASNTTMPLHLAAGHGNVEAVRLLLEHGADVNGLEQNSYTPLHYAVNGSSKEVVELLFEKGAAISEKPGYWPIFQHWALGAGDTNIAASLLAHGASINATDREGKTALHNAAQQGTLQTVDWLLKNGAQVNARDNKGVTPLSLTKSRNRGHVVERRKEIADLLRRYGAKE